MVKIFNNWDCPRTGTVPIIDKLLKSISFLILMLITFFIAPVFSENKTDKLTLASAIEIAINNNSELRQLNAKFESSKIKAKKEGILDEPKFGIGILNLPSTNFSLREMDETMKEFKLMQMFPFFGKLSLREEVAILESKIINEEYNEKRNEIISKVKKTYFDLFLIIKQTEITEKNKKILEGIVRITDARYSSGVGVQNDVLRAQVELAKMLSDLIMLTQKKKTSIARLNALLFRDAETPIENIEEIKTSKFNMSISEIQKLTLENKPILKLANLMIQKNETYHSLSRKEFLPDFDLGVSYGQRDSRIDGTKRDDMVSVMLTLNLPFLWGKRGYEIDSSKVEIEQAKSNYDSMRNEIFFMISDLSAEIEKDKKMINLFETGILPQAKQALDIAKANYESGKIDFLALLDTLVTLYKYEIEYYNILIEYEKHLAELEFVIGRSL